MAEEKNMEQPKVDLQELLDSVLRDEPTEFVFRGKKHKLGWLRKGTMAKCSHIQLREKNEWKRNVKICVCVLLNNIWKIRFFYAIYWRWLYYVKDLDVAEVLRVLDVSKKNSIDRILTGYHISDRDDGRDDDDDEERSKSYPSRTSWGAAFSLAEKFGFLFARKYGIAAYDYWWGYSSAQVDLMVADQPLVVYPKSKDSAPKTPTRKSMDDFADRWRAKRQGKSMAGQKINLGEYLRNGIS